MGNLNIGSDDVPNALREIADQQRADAARSHRVLVWTLWAVLATLLVAGATLVAALGD